MEPATPVAPMPPTQPSHPEVATTTSKRPSSVLPILLLIFVYPIGLIYMWLGVKHWNGWVKTIWSVPALLTIIVFGLILISINPNKQFAAANNVKRSSDANAIVNAIDAYIYDTNRVPTELSPLAHELDSGSYATLCAKLIPQYVAALPTDPFINNGQIVKQEECMDHAWDTGYTVQLNQDGRSVTVTAPRAEMGAKIIVSHN